MTRIAALLLLCSLCLGVTAQDTRPTVGVVLSGGGAKGLAHIGVLQVLEEYGIEVDYVAGTSMGAIIGGLYASGYSARELDSIVQKNNLREIILGNDKRQNTAIRRRKYYEKTVLELTFEDGQLNVPSGLSNGQQVYDFLYYNSFPHNLVQHFDSLPIPFFCIGTDLVTGEEVIMDSGNLPLAMRASGSLPSLLHPVVVDDRIIVDGGVVNNIPVDEMRKRGIDIVIAVSVESGLYKEEELSTLPNILAQISTFEAHKRSLAQYDNSDLLIRPDISKFTILDFNLGQDLILTGRQAAETSAAQLIKIAKAQGGPTKPKPKFKKYKHKYLKIKDIEIDIEPELEFHVSYHLPFEEGDYISLDELRNAINNLRQSSYFQFIDYHLDIDGDEVTLYLNPLMRNSYQNVFGVGIHYDDFFKGALLIHAQRRQLFNSRDKAAIDLVVGNRVRYDFDYFINRGKYLSPGFRSRYQYNDVPVRLNTPLVIDSTLSVDKIDFGYRDFYNELSITTYQHNNTLIELGAGVQYFRIESDQLESMGNNFQLDDTWYGVGEARYYYDDMDSKQFSMRGSRLQASAKAIAVLSSTLLEEDELGVNITIDADHLYPLSRRFSLGIDLVAGTSFGFDGGPANYNFGSAARRMINNFKMFPGLSFGQASGPSAVKISPYARWQADKNIYLTLAGQALWLERPDRPIIASKNRIFGGYFSLGFSSVLGPIELIVAKADNEEQYYLNFGYWF